MSNNSKLVNRAIYLSWLTIIYNLVEGFVSLAFGIGDESVALAGFGVDSLVEVASAIFVLWRFRGKTMHRERTAVRGIGLLFIVLSAVTAVASLVQLYSHAHPSTTLPGLVISVLSLSFMLFLWSAKKKVGLALQSATVLKDAACSLACIKLSIILLAGSAVFLFFPSLWWADSVAALILSFFFAKEGHETIRGGCGCSCSCGIS